MRRLRDCRETTGIRLGSLPVDHSRPYAIHSQSECDRLERQAVLAGIEDHLRFVAVPPDARVLDAGCGSGSMSRLIAAHHLDARVTGVDLRADYLAYARQRAAGDGLHNLDFHEGDIFRLPFPAATFDVVWSKYVLQWVKDPQAVIAEFTRVTKPAGLVVCCNFDGFGMTHWPEDPALQPLVERVLPRLIDPFVGRKLAPLFHAAGLVDVAVDFEPDRLFTVIGSIDPARRQNWVEQWAAGRPYVAEILGSEAAADQLSTAFLAYQDRADTSSYAALYFVRGKRLISATRVRERHRLAETLCDSGRCAPSARPEGTRQKSDNPRSGK
jgi:SAM-dependent methyltransferase